MSDREDEIASARTFLFVPGDRPERFDKAASSGADLVILDLEDAVAPEAKSRARAAVREWLSSERRAMVRINGADTEWFEEDLALSDNPGLVGIMFPKACPGPSLDRAAGSVPIIALVESAVGAAEVGVIAATRGVARIALGAIDLSLDLDIRASDRIFDPLRLQISIASRAAGLPGPIEGVTVDVRDTERAAADMAHARTFGFTAKLCIHPAQLAPVAAAMRPSDSEIEQARRIVDADEASAGAAVAIEGQMVDRPIVARARRLLAAS